MIVNRKTILIFCVHLFELNGCVGKGTGVAAKYLMKKIDKIYQVGDLKGVKGESTTDDLRMEH